jgi:type IV pilus assembly protein PilA
MKKITKNNKGFSLIELIIVIAIMAVLVAIIAPNLTKYLGSSKTQTDNKNADEIKAQIKNCISDATTQDIAVNAWTGQDLTTLSTSSDSFDLLVADALDGSTLTSKVDSSKNFYAKITKQANGGYKVEVSSDGGTTYK